MIFGDEELVDAACFYARKLGIAGKNFHLDICIDELDDDLLGEFGPTGAGYQIVLNRNQTELPMLQVLAHEMVHVKQHVMGQLIDAEPDTIWLGRTYAPAPWFMLPWEHEAMNKEYPLYAAWKEENNDELF